MKNRNIIYIFLLLLPQYALSQVDKAHGEISMSAGIMTNQSYDTRLSYQYYLTKSIGIGVSIGYYNQWQASHIPQSENNNQEWDYWRLSEKNSKPQNIYLEPSLSINSPATTTQKSHQKNIYTSDMQCFFWDIRPAIRVENKGGIFVDFGYGLSDFDVYSSYRKIKIQEKTLNDFYPKKKLNNTFFLKVGGYF